MSGVNCALVDRCTAYHVIEQKHNQPHISDAPDFSHSTGAASLGDL